MAEKQGNRQASFSLRPSSISTADDRDRNGYHVSPKRTLSVRSWDSAIDDDVFLTPNNPSEEKYTNDCTRNDAFHVRCDSGVSSSYGRSSISTNSEPRLSTRSWNTVNLPSSKVQTDSLGGNCQSTKQPKLQKQKSLRRLTKFLTKHVPFTSSFDTGSKSHSSNEHLPVLVRASQIIQDQSSGSHMIHQNPTTHNVQMENHAENTYHFQEESLVDTNKMLNALKLLEQRVLSGQFAPHMGQQITFGTCAVGFFDINGGRLTLPNVGVSLFIPPGAVESKDPQMIYIYALPSSRNEPDLDPKETWLTPTVECGPSGLQFAKDVLLSMSHCAINHPQWNVQVHRGNGESPEWKKLETGGETITFLDDKKVTLALNHFSPYKVSGRSSTSSDEETFVSKWMKAAVLPVGLTTPEGGTIASLKLRLCKLQDWRVSTKFGLLCLSLIFVKKSTVTKQTNNPTNKQTNKQTNKNKTKTKMTKKKTKTKNDKTKQQTKQIKNKQTIKQKINK